ncbi:hypothetical protein TNCV_72181 [Trichonephila clavipes]|nr:hypothetical protein TNCV_72181 [Trichonephila clavipes]
MTESKRSEFHPQVEKELFGGGSITPWCWGIEGESSAPVTNRKRWARTRQVAQKVIFQRKRASRRANNTGLFKCNFEARRHSRGRECESGVYSEWPERPRPSGKDESRARHLHRAQARTLSLLRRKDGRGKGFFRNGLLRLHLRLSWNFAKVQREGEHPRKGGCARSKRWFEFICMMDMKILNIESGVVKCLFHHATDQKSWPSVNEDNGCLDWTW